MTRKTTTFALLALVTVGTTLAAAAFGPTAQYIAGATAVVKEPGSAPILDQGGAICDDTGPSLGGACITFGPYDSVLVGDGAAGAAVAFQVCIDNNGDGVCGGPQGGGAAGRCFDQIFFSHDDAGRFFNPLGPLPNSFLPGCGSGAPFAGYVVFLCEGVHGGAGSDGSATTPHTHGVTTGSVTGVHGGSGFGDFCSPGGDDGREAAGPGKPYKLV